MRFLIRWAICSSLILGGCQAEGPPPAERSISVEAGAVEVLAAASPRRRLVEISVRRVSSVPGPASGVLTAASADLARRVEGPAATSARRLYDASLTWPPADRDRALGRVDALERADRPSGTLTWAADALIRVGAPSAPVVLDRAVGLARRAPDRRRRDYEYRSLAAAAAITDPSLTGSLAAGIQDPSLRVWALTAAGKRTGATDPDAARKYFGAAYTASARQPDRYRRCLGLIRLADAWRRVDPEAGRETFEEAARNLPGSNQPNRRLDALVRLGQAWGGQDPQKAFELAVLIEPRRSADRFELFIQAAANPDPEARDALLRAARQEALKMTAGRDRALARTAVLTATVDPDRADDIWAAINPEARMVRDAAAGRLVEAWAENRPGRALEKARAIESAYFRAKALARLAVAARRAGHPSAPKILVEAGQAAGQDASGRSACELAQAWAWFSPRKGVEIAQSLKDAPGRARCLTQVAAGLAGRGRGKDAARAAGAAERTAESLNDAEERASAWSELAALWRQLEPQRADYFYSKACQDLTGRMSRVMAE